jgi:NhaP-type Na+/H+ or K+/H+ antiporter
MSDLDTFLESCLLGLLLGLLIGLALHDGGVRGRRPVWEPIETIVPPDGR